MADFDTDLVCGACRKRGGFSPVVAAIVVYAPSLPNGCYFLEPDLASGEQYRLCSGCSAALVFLRRAMAAHPKTRMTADWTSATFIFVDGEVEPWRLPREMADAFGRKIARA